MKILRARTAGFCMGVSLALTRLDTALADAAPGPQRRLATLGPIIHNPRVIEAYAAKGVICLDDPDQARVGDRVIIRAHGIARHVEEALYATGAQVLDATCPKVKEAQLAIAAQQRGYGDKGCLLLFGEAEHPEVKGLLSYATPNAMVFATLEQLASLPLDPDGLYYLASQTTQSIATFSEMQKILAKRLSQPLPVLHTICNATQKRQEEAILLADQVDIMIIVGGLNSGNTRRLAEIVQARNVETLLVENSGQLPCERLRTKKTAGLTAGASTPASHIDDVYEKLCSL